MANPQKNSSILPQISRKLIYRSVGLAIVCGILVGGYFWIQEVRSDLGGLETAETAGWIAAIEYLPQGQQAILISPDGQIHKNPGYIDHATDRDVTWSPKGNFIYFVSDRVDHNYNLFRWSPPKSESEQRTIGTRARSNLKFPAQVGPDADSVAKGLLTTGGLVQEFDPRHQTTSQVLPPSAKEISQGGDENGTESQFEGAYGNLGTSIRTAEWCGGGRYIAAIMRRDAGEIMIIQDMKLVDGKYSTPKPIVAGDHVDFAVNPKDGNLIYAVQNFQWPDGKPPLGKDGKPVKKPFANGLVAVSFDGPLLVLATSPGNQVFSSPTISPDGTTLAIIANESKDGDLTPLGLSTLPLKNTPGFKPLKIPGDIHEPSWSPDGTRLLAAVRLPGKPRSIYEIPVDGSPPRNITGDTGNFGFPKYSPQQKGS